MLCRGGLGTEIRVLDWEDNNFGTIGTGSFKWPSSILADKNENLYVSEEAQNKVYVFSKDGALLNEWGESGDGEGQFDRPTGMSFDTDNNIVLSDTLNNRIQKYTVKGEFIAQFGSEGSGPGEFQMPWGTTVDEEGFIYVSDWRNDRVQKFTSCGEFVMEFGHPGKDKGQLNRPTDVAVDKDGDVYICDWGNDRVQLFDQTGRFVEQFIGDASLSISGMQYALANPVTLRIREMADLEPTRRLQAPVSVVVDDEIRLFITDFGSHRVQVYKKDAIQLSEDQIAPPLRSPTLFTS